MNKSYSKKKLIIITVICVIVAAIIILGVLIERNKKPSPTEDLSETSKEWTRLWQEQTKKGNEEFKNRPEQKLKDNWSGKVWGETFSIEYYASTDEFYVDVGSASCTKCRDDALNWLKKQGVDPNKLKIVWIPSEPQKSTPYYNPKDQD